MAVYDDVVIRLAMLGYEVTDADKPRRAVSDLPRGAVYQEQHQPAGSAGGTFRRVGGYGGGAVSLRLQRRRENWARALTFPRLQSPISEGDTSVTFAGASDGAVTPEARFGRAAGAHDQPAAGRTGGVQEDEMVNAYRKALQSLWTGVCTVYVRVPSPTPDPATGRTVWAVEAVAEDVPCRLSFETLSETQDESSAAKVTQSVKLFLDPAVPLPAGSKLTVTQNGRDGRIRTERRGGGVFQPQRGAAGTV